MTSIQRRRVVITGMGTVNPCGLTVPETWEALMAGKSGIKVIDNAAFRDRLLKALYKKAQGPQHTY